jgi:hypothetical protein
MAAAIGGHGGRCVGLGGMVISRGGEIATPEAIAGHGSDGAAAAVAAAIRPKPYLTRRIVRSRRSEATNGEEDFSDLAVASLIETTV